MKLRGVALFFLCVVVFFHSSQTHAIITVNGLPNGAGDHLTSPGVPAFGINVDGVASLEIDSSPSCTAVLISDHHALTAAHCLDFNGDGQVTVGNDFADDFFPQDELTLRFELAGGEVVLGFDPEASQLASSNWFDIEDDRDLAVITLDSIAPESIPRYPIYDLLDEVGQQSVKVGYGTTGTGLTGDVVFTSDKRAGLNVYDSVGLPEEFVAESQLGYDFDNGLASQNAFLQNYDIPSDLGFGDDEVNSAPGDSGGPTFIQGSVAGITSFGFTVPTDIDDITNSTFGELSFDTRVSTLADFIVQATDGEVVLHSSTLVPEPTTLILLSFAAVSSFGWQHSDRRRILYRQASSI